MIDTKFKSAILIVATLTVAFSPQLCLADMYDPVTIGGNIGDSISGSLSSETGLITTDGWEVETTLEWTITNMGGYIKYCYTLTVPVGSPSHYIIQTSNSFTTNDLLDVLEGIDVDEIELKEHYESQGNNGLPIDGLYGLKFGSASEEDIETICFTSTRLPMEGIFYTVDGTHPDPSGNSEVATLYNDYPDYWVPVPDTVVPVPPAVILGMIGMGIAGIKLRKYA